VWLVILHTRNLVRRRRVGVTVQLGGSDQWGNIINGVGHGGIRSRSEIRKAFPAAPARTSLPNSPPCHAHRGSVSRRSNAPPPPPRRVLSSGGFELGRKAAGAALFGVTAPLVTTADGRKMGYRGAFGRRSMQESVQRAVGGVALVEVLADLT